MILLFINSIRHFSLMFQILSSMVFIWKKRSYINIMDACKTCIRSARAQIPYEHTHKYHTCEHKNMIRACTQISSVTAQKRYVYTHKCYMCTRTNVIPCTKCYMCARTSIVRTREEILCVRAYKYHTCSHRNIVRAHIQM